MKRSRSDAIILELQISHCVPKERTFHEVQCGELCIMCVLQDVCTVDNGIIR